MTGSVSPQQKWQERNDAYRYDTIRNAIAEEKKSRKLSLDEALQMVEDLPERYKEDPKFIESPDILQALKVVFNKAPLAFDRIVSSLTGIKSRSLIRQLNADKPPSIWEKKFREKKINDIDKIGLKKTLDGVDCEILEEVKTIGSNPRKDETTPTPTPPPAENIQCLACGHPTGSGMAAIITGVSVPPVAAIKENAEFSKAFIFVFPS